MITMLPWQPTIATKFVEVFSLWRGMTAPKLTINYKTVFQINFFCTVFTLAHIKVPAISYKSVWLSQTLYVWSSQDKLKPVTTKWKIRHFRHPQINIHCMMLHTIEPQTRGSQVIMVARLSLTFTSATGKATTLSSRCPKKVSVFDQQ